MRTLHDHLADDSVTELLRSLRVRTTLYCRSELRAPWGFAVRARDTATFHLVTDGECWLEVDGLDGPVRLGTGDLVLLMTGLEHRLRDETTSPVEWLDELLVRIPMVGGALHQGGDGPLTQLLCGGFMIEGAQANPLILGMPPLLRLEGQDPTMSQWVDSLLTLLDLEVAQPRPGADAVLACLSDLLLTHAVRSYLAALAHTDAPQVAALRDPRIAKAVRLAHADPGRPWTVEELAAEVAMSRSAFAARFRQLTGQAPMHYVTRCRLARAAAYLGQDGTTLFEVALRVGYDSEASFTRAFSRAYGVAPGAYRRRLHEPIVP